MMMFTTFDGTLPAARRNGHSSPFALQSPGTTGFQRSNQCILDSSVQFWFDVYITILFNDDFTSLFIQYLHVVFCVVLTTQNNPSFGEIKISDAVGISGPSGPLLPWEGKRLAWDARPRRRASWLRAMGRPHHRQKSPPQPWAPNI